MEHQDSVVPTAYTQQVGQADEPKSILQPWVAALGLRLQGTIMGAMRGCDGTPREDPSKALVRSLRCLCLVSFDERELTAFPQGYMSFRPAEVVKAFDLFLGSYDQYSVHFYTHLMYAFEVVGLHHPRESQRVWYYNAYKVMAEALHLNPETPRQFKDRMSVDAVARKIQRHKKIEEGSWKLSEINARWKNNLDESSRWFICTPNPAPGSTGEYTYLNETAIWTEWFSTAVLFDTEEAASDFVKQYPEIFIDRGILIKIFLAKQTK